MQIIRNERQIRDCLRTACSEAVVSVAQVVILGLEFGLFLVEITARKLDILTSTAEHLSASWTHLTLRE